MAWPGEGHEANAVPRVCPRGNNGDDQFDRKHSGLDSDYEGVTSVTIVYAAWAQVYDKYCASYSARSGQSPSFLGHDVMLISNIAFDSFHAFD